MIFSTTEHSLKKGLRSNPQPRSFSVSVWNAACSVLFYALYRSLCLSSQNATALAAATFSESTPFIIGIFTM